MNCSLQKNTTVIASDTAGILTWNIPLDTHKTLDEVLPQFCLMSIWNSTTLNIEIIDSFSGKALKVKVTLIDQPYNSTYQKLQKGITVVMDIYHSFF